MNDDLLHCYEIVINDHDDTAFSRSVDVAECLLLMMIKIYALEKISLSMNEFMLKNRLDLCESSVRMK